MGSTRLDTTVADLYRDHGIHGRFTATTHCVFGHMDLHPQFPRETVYPEDEEPVPYGANKQEIARLKKTILGLKPVRRAFALGNMDVILFKPDVAAENVERVLSQLPLGQRFQPRYVDLNGGNVREKLQEVTEGRALLYWRPQGWMLEHRCLIETNMSYEMNSKRFLISSGIQTPTSEMVSLVDGIDCSILSSKRLPFVVKLCLAGSGFGTYIITTEDRRKDMLAAMTKYKQRGGTEVLLSAYIDLKQDLSVHFLVGALGDERNRDDPLFLGVTVQDLTENGHCTGGSIDYSAQSELEILLRDTVRETAQRLPLSFVGWAGVDIVIDKDGKQWVVDLNPRFTGSMPLCLLSGHFYHRLQLPCAQFGTFQYRGATGDVHGLLSQMIDSGQVVLIAATSIDVLLNMADLVWGGRDKEELGRIAGLISKTLGMT
ncbi:hypothetical protein MMC22_006127 [Lobaria immixta]|nr:hypothetical protein [Lobaria immixta]